MSHGLESTDFEWLDPRVQRSSGSLSSVSSETRPSQFLKEGYLHVMEKVPKKGEASQGRAMSLVRKISNPAILGGWSRRWCVLSRTVDTELQEDESPWLGVPTQPSHTTDLPPPQAEEEDVTEISTLSNQTVEKPGESESTEVSAGNYRLSESSNSSQVESLHLLLYKDQNSFSNMQSPGTVLPLDKCSKLCSLPTHSKSEYTFSITFNNREILFYTDTSSEFEAWLNILQDTLKLQDAYFHSPLKGLPKQKAMRKDSISQSTTHHQHDASRDGGSPTHQEPTATTSASVSAMPQSAEEGVKREGRVAGVVADPSVQRKHFFSTRRNSKSENSVRVLNVKKLVPETC